MKQKLAIIGAGISGLSAAAYAARAGHEVHVFEKTTVPEAAPGSLRRIMVIRSIWGPAGIGCPTSLTVFSATLDTKPATSTSWCH
ncbi:FAD-dependent oxidoreductase [Chitinophaga sedimenti]|uniref:FAD-dependent oxidoreductase n=1 Tax=Chitinophaga sedimenti TaxID=2033606 RepID=UPI0035589494